MRRSMMAGVLATGLFTASICAAVEIKTEEQKTFYAIGQAVSRSLEVFNLTPAEFEIVRQGLMDAQSGKTPDFDLNAYTPKLQDLARARRKAEGDRLAVAGKEFIEKIAKEKGALKTSSGLVYLPQAEGKGDAPKATDTVKVHYRGTLIDGKEFDSSFKRGQPLEFKLDGVIKCWTEGLQLMKPGGKAKLICPPNLAYGDTGAGEKILPGATLQFEVELLEAKPSVAAKQTVTAPSPQPTAPATAGPRVGNQPAAPAAK